MSKERSKSEELNLDTLGQTLSLIEMVKRIGSSADLRRREILEAVETALFLNLESMVSISDDPCRPSSLREAFQNLMRFDDLPEMSNKWASVVHPMAGTNDYRGWYPISASTASRWCPKQSRYDGPRPGGTKHKGLDIYGPEGREVLAVVDGKIEYRPKQPGGWGNHIYLYFLRSSVQYVACYAHLDPATPTTGVKVVKAGDVIGKVGCTGNAGTNDVCDRSHKCHNKIACADHLHFELFRLDDPATKIDPVPFFGFTIGHQSDESCEECGSTEQLR